MASLFEKILSRTWNFAAGLGRKRMKAGLMLGFQVMDGRAARHKVFMTHSRRAEHISITGKTGTGKSFEIRNFCRQDIREGRGFVVIDRHGDLIPFILQEIAGHESKTKEDLSSKVIVISPSDPDYSVGLNVLSKLSGQQSFVQISEFAQVLKTRWNLDHFGARTEELLRNALYVVSDCGLTLLELAPLLSNTSFRAACLKKVTNQEVRSYFEERYNAASEAMQATLSAPVLNKVTGFIADPHFRHILGQRESTFSILEALEKGYWVLLDLNRGKLGEHAATIGSLFFTHLKSAVFARRGRKITTLYLDEIQTLVPSDNSLEVLFSECRKFAVSIVCANQFLEQLPTQVRAAIAAIGTHIYFQLSSGDAQHTAASLDGGKSLAELLKNLPARNFLLKSGSTPWRQVAVPSIAGLKVDYSDLYTRSRERWARKRNDIEAEIVSRRPTAKGSAKEVIDDWE